LSAGVVAVLVKDACFVLLEGIQDEYVSFSASHADPVTAVDVRTIVLPDGNPGALTVPSVWLAASISVAVF